MMKEEKLPLLFLTRQFIYFLLLILCSIGMWKTAQIHHSLAFEESGIIENIQVSLLFLTAGLFALWIFLFPKNRVLSVFLMTLPLTAGCRELDAFLDNAIPVVGWQFSLLFPVIAGIYALKHWKDFQKSLVHFVKSPTFSIMMCAMVIIVPIAQCIGHKSFITDVIGPTTDARVIRRLFEEAIELEGYLLILLSAIEYYFSQLCVKKK